MCDPSTVWQVGESVQSSCELQRVEDIEDIEDIDVDNSVDDGARSTGCQDRQCTPDELQLGIPELLPAQRKRATTQGHADVQQPPQPADTAQITELQRQLADAKAAAAEARVEIAVAKADGLEKLLAERTRQEERYDQAQEVKNQQVNELIQVTKQQSEAATMMTKAFVPDQRLIQLKSLDAMQKASNEFHAFKNASR